MAAPSRLEGLDALRGIAALCILALHTSAAYASHATLAVDLFFVLSGYVMARVYEPRFARGLTAAAFMRARLARLLPMMLAGSALGGLVALLTIGRASFAYLPNLLLLPAPVDGNWAYALNPVVWSLLLEIVANLFHALVLGRVRTPVLVLGLVLLLGPMLHVALHVGLDFGPRPGGWGWALVRVDFGYGTGVLLQRVLRDRCPVAWPTRPLAPLLWAALPFCFVLSWRLGGWPGWADFLFVAVLCPVLVAAALRPGSGHPLLSWLGDISFPLYATHAPLVIALTGRGSSAFVTPIVAIGLAALLARRQARTGAAPARSDQPATA